MGLFTKVIASAIGKKVGIEIHNKAYEKDKQVRSIDGVLSLCTFDNTYIVKDIYTTFLNNQGRTQIYDTDGNIVFYTKSTINSIPTITLMNKDKIEMGNVCLDDEYLTEEYSSCLEVHYFDHRTQAFYIYRKRKSLSDYIVEFVIHSKGLFGKTTKYNWYINMNNNIGGFQAYGKNENNQSIFNIYSFSEDGIDDGFIINFKNKEEELHVMLIAVAMMMVHGKRR